jgi:hypothetical protein
VRDPQLAQDRRGVEVDPLADDPVAAGVELEDRDHAARELPAGRWQAAEGAEVRALQVELGQHRVLGVVEPDQLVALVGECGARLLEVARHLLGAVVHVAVRDDLVTRVVERPHRHVELVPVLGLHVLTDDGLAAGR